MEKFTIISEDFNIPLLPTDWKEKNNSVGYRRTDQQHSSICFNWHIQNITLNSTIYIFKSAHGLWTKIDHTLSHKINFNIFQKNKNLQNI